MLHSKKAIKVDIYIKEVSMKFGMYTRGTNEGGTHINVVDAHSLQEAEAYFAGMKRLSITQFKNLFVVREIKNSQSNKNLLLG
jgi:hypothetical protein